MNIICLNAWGGFLSDELLAYVATENPDVLCLQEVISSPERRLDWLTYRDGDHVLRQRANLYFNIREVLPDHVAAFCPAAQGILWDDDTPVSSQWGLATFVHRSLPIIGQVQGFVHKGFSPRGFGEHPRSRNAHGIRVYDYNQERSVSITHMHGLRDLNGKIDTPERRAQAGRLLEISRQVSEVDDIVVICGDFNVEPNSETIALLEDSGMAELVTARGFPSTRTSHYAKSGKFADYMLVSDTKAVKTFDVVYDPEVSDHCPLRLII